MPELSLQGKLTQDPFTFIQVFTKKQCMETVVVGKKWEQPWVFIDERVLMRIWETKCHVWIDTETNRVRTLYKHTFQRDAHANTHWSTEENLLFPSLLHFPFFISPSLHPPSLPHVWDMLSWKRLAALRVYKRWRGFVQSLFCFPPFETE